MSAIFHIEDAVIYRFQQKVLGPFSYTFEKDLNYMISGLNGAGKSSFLQAIKGRLPLRSGKIEFFINDQNDIYKWKRRHLQLVSFADNTREFLNIQRYYQQRFHAFDTDDFTIEEYLVQDGFDHKNPQHINIVNKSGLTDLLKVNRIKLSSGQSRKYLIVKALLKSPKILLLDNPYVGLDKENRLLINNLIDELSRSIDIQFIIAGQYTELPKTVKHIINLGKTPSHDDPLIIPDCLLSYFNETSHWPEYSTVLELQDVTVSYADKAILNKLNWKILKGHKCSILGKNGSGKSTVIGLIAADHPQAYKNDVSLFGKRRSNRDSIWDIKKNIGLVSSELHAYFHDPGMSCFSIVKQGLYETIYNNAVFSKVQEQTIHALFQYFDLPNSKNKIFNQCSTGEQRLVLFLRALVKNPPLLLLDEPFQVLDSRQVSRAKYLLEEVLSAQHTMIFITHFQHEIPNSVTFKMDLEE